MDKKKILIIVIIIAAAAAYYFLVLKKSATTSAPASGSSSPTPSANNPNTTQTPPLVTPTGADELGIATPIAISSPVATFMPGTSSAQIGGSGTTSDPTNGMPSGFITWYQSLGPKSKVYVASQIHNMTTDEINLVNTLVTQNRWGDPTLAPAWNAFSAKYGTNPSFNSFSGFKNY